MIDDQSIRLNRIVRGDAKKEEVPALLEVERQRSCSFDRVDREKLWVNQILDV